MPVLQTTDPELQATPENASKFSFTQVISLRLALTLSAAYRYN
jgi:hypothetical protein